MKKWKILQEYTSNTNLIKLLLENRGITSAQDKEVFLNPPKLSELIAKMPNDFKQSLLNAKNMILEQIKVGGPLVIYGDYDADGVCSTAILYNTIKNELKYDCAYFIPNRFSHGYGLSKGAIDEVFAKCEPDKQILFVTVDTGITATEPADYIKSKGHKLIITDHHQKPDPLPKADVIVWNDQMVASSISWILSKALGSRSMQSIALAALATVTDLQPLLGFNRTIVKEGLRVLNENPPVGIQKLIEISGKREKGITTYDLGFVLGPRLNATGRLDSASESLLLLIESDEQKIGQFAQNLHTANTTRQDKTLEMFEIAGQQAGEKMPKIIISQNKDYHEGIIGLVAAKLVQKHYRPAIVISLEENYGKGSVRSVEGVDIIALLRRFEHLFTNLGGHKMAAGFTIPKENIALLEAELLKVAETEILDEMLEPVLNIDAKIPLDLVDMNLLNELEKLQPHGIGNPEPVFMTEQVGITEANVVGREQTHVSFRFYYRGNTEISGAVSSHKQDWFCKGIYFNAPEEVKNLKQGDKVDIAYNVKLNEFNGVQKVDLVLRDMKK